LIIRIFSYPKYRILINRNIIRIQQSELGTLNNTGHPLSLILLTKLKLWILYRHHKKDLLVELIIFSFIWFYLKIRKVFHLLSIWYTWIQLMTLYSEFSHDWFLFLSFFSNETTIIKHWISVIKEVIFSLKCSFTITSLFQNIYSLYFKCFYYY